MLRDILSAAVGSAMLTAVAVSGAQAASSPLGVWINDQGRGGIEISQCGDKLCGKVVWLQNAKDVKGCGLQILGDLEQAGAGTWEGGWIYSPDNKRKYDVEIRPLDGDKLRVFGYAGIKLFGKSMIWTRAPADLKRCETTQAVLTPAPDAAPAPEASAGKPAPSANTANPPPPVASTAKQPEQTAPSSGSAEAQPQPAPSPNADDAAKKAAPPPAPSHAEKAPAKPHKSRTARAEDRDCVLKVPYVTITYPCKDD